MVISQEGRDGAVKTEQALQWSFFPRLRVCFVFVFYFTFHHKTEDV